MSALPLHPFEVVTPTGEVVAERASEFEARREAETMILAGQAERLRIYGPHCEPLMEAVRCGPRHVAWYCRGAI